MLALMREKKPPSLAAEKLRPVARSESALFVSIATVAILIGTGKQLLENISHPVLLLAVFLWLFVVILWSAISVVRHADCLAIKFGEPYGTVILTLSAIAIEVAMISTAMLHGANNPTLGRDAIFAVVMIALNGLVGICLLTGGLLHREQHYNILGVNSYLNVIMALAVLGLVLPNFTTSTSGPTLSALQGIFVAVTSVLLYGIFLFIQTMRHSQYFIDAKGATVASAGRCHDHKLQVRSTGFHVSILLTYLFAVVFLAEKFSIPLDNFIE